MDVKQSDGNALEKQYVTCSIAGDTYGIDVSCVQEVTGITAVSKVPNSKNFMKGVLDLRGTVIPLVDMRLRFGFEEKPYDAATAVLITEVKNKYVGMIVDSVSDVIGFASDRIQEPFHYSVKIETDCVTGIVRTDKGIIVLLDAGKILDPDMIG